MESEVPIPTIPILPKHDDSTGMNVATFNQILEEHRSRFADIRVAKISDGLRKLLVTHPSGESQSKLLVEDIAEGEELKPSVERSLRSMFDNLFDRDWSQDKNGDEPD